MVGYANRKVLFHYGAVIDGRGRVTIGSGSSIGRGVIIRTSPTGAVDIDRSVWISTDVEIETVGQIRIGFGTTIQRRSTINGNVTIGRECIFAPNVFISSGTHPFRVAPSMSIREQERQIAAGQLPNSGLDRPISIGDDCWLGTNCVVCPGVTIGSGSVIGANSVVTRDVPPMSVYAGSPAKKIGER